MSGRTGLTGRIAVVTGGSGIGAACATALAEEGADIALLFHGDAAAAAKVAPGVEGLGRRAVCVPVDVGVEDEVEHALTIRSARSACPIPSSTRRG